MRGTAIEKSTRYEAGYEKACGKKSATNQMVSGAREAVAFWSMRGDGSADYWRGWLDGLIEMQSATSS